MFPNLVECIEHIATEILCDDFMTTSCCWNKSIDVCGRDNATDNMLVGTLLITCRKTKKCVQHVL